MVRPMSKVETHIYIFMVKETHIFFANLANDSNSIHSNLSSRAFPLSNLRPNPGGAHVNSTLHIYAPEKGDLPWYI
jgi:hypothetical protein